MLNRNMFDTFIHFDSIRSNFDIYCTVNHKKYVIKMLNNIDSIKKENAIYLSNAASLFNASPFIIGKQDNNGLLKPFVIYYRFNIPAGNEETFVELIKGNVRIEKRNKEYVKIDKNKFINLMKEAHIDLKQLSKLTNISFSTLYRYRTGKLERAHVNNVKRISEVLGGNIESKIQFKVKKRIRVKLENPSKEGVRLKHTILFIDYGVSVKTIQKRSKIINKYVDEGIQYIALKKSNYLNV